MNKFIYFKIKYLINSISLEVNSSEFIFLAGLVPDAEHLRSGCRRARPAAENCELQHCAGLAAYVWFDAAVDGESVCAYGCGELLSEPRLRA